LTICPQKIASPYTIDVDNQGNKNQIYHAHFDEGKKQRAIRSQFEWFLLIIWVCCIIKKRNLFSVYWLRTALAHFKFKTALIFQAFVLPFILFFKLRSVVTKLDSDLMNLGLLDAGRKCIHIVNSGTFFVNILLFKRLDYLQVIFLFVVFIFILL
jgi:hypothetical protein